MTREDVISWLEYLSDDARSKADGLVPTNIEIACGMAIDALKAQEPRVMTLWEAVGIIDRPVYLERNVLMPDKSVNRQECWALVCATDDEHMIRLATPYGEEKWHVGAYGIGWRCWTSRPTEAEREAIPWN